MKVVISERNGMFTFDPVDSPGSPMVGRGKTLVEAAGDFLICYQREFGLELVVDSSAQAAENKRHEQELAKR